MGRAPCCDKANVKKGPWSPEEDAKLKDYITKYGTGGNWIALPQKVGLRRCGKSCRLRWLNYLRPNIRHGEFTDEEDKIICTLYASIGSRWSVIAGQLAGRTDNDIKNYWNTKLKKKLLAATSSTIAISNYNSTPGTFLQNHPPLVYSYQNAGPNYYYYHDPLISESLFNNNNLLPVFGSTGGGGDNNINITDQNLWYFTANQENQTTTTTADGYSSSSSSAAATYGCLSTDQNPQDYYSSIQEIKELISCSNNFIIDDEDHMIKTEDKLLPF